MAFLIPALLRAKYSRSLKDTNRFHLTLLMFLYMYKKQRIRVDETNNSVILHG